MTENQKSLKHIIIMKIISWGSIQILIIMFVRLWWFYSLILNEKEFLIIMRNVQNVMEKLLNQKKPDE